MKDLWIARDAKGRYKNSLYLYDKQPDMNLNGEFTGVVNCSLQTADYGVAGILDYIPVQKGECYKISFTKEAPNGTS